jgi:hypothetical protein
LPKLVLDEAPPRLSVFFQRARYGVSFRKVSPHLLVEAAGRSRDLRPAVLRGLQGLDSRQFEDCPVFRANVLCFPILRDLIVAKRDFPPESGWWW